MCTGRVMVRIVSLTLLLCLISFDAFGHVTCMNRQRLVAFLKDAGETVAYVGVANSDNPTPVEFWMNKKDGTFSLVIVQSAIVACFLAVGTKLRSAEGQEVKQDEGRHGFDSLLKGRDGR